MDKWNNFSSLILGFTHAAVHIQSKTLVLQCHATFFFMVNKYLL
jgi:hypothetical protein